MKARYIPLEFHSSVFEPKNDQNLWESKESDGKCHLCTEALPAGMSCFGHHLHSPLPDH